MYPTLNCSVVNLKLIYCLKNNRFWITINFGIYEINDLNKLNVKIILDATEPFLLTVNQFRKIYDKI